MRIGILGGTFDPPHAGHIALAEAAVEQLELDEVIFVPAARNPLKETRSSHPKDRLEMTRRAIARHEKFCVSDIEIARGGKSYTIETLTELQIARPGEYWIIMGTDALREFPRWRTPEKILLKARLAVALRAPQKKDEILAFVPDWLPEHIDWIEAPVLEVSSSEIRVRAQDKRRPFAQWLSKDVLDYIGEKKLYK